MRCFSPVRSAEPKHFEQLDLGLLVALDAARRNFQKS